jgi:hypothetical protein
MPYKRLELILLKVERAEKHISDLNLALNAFYNREPKPYGVDGRIDPKTREPVHYVSKLDDVPKTISPIIGDVLQNLRSALDHLIYQLVAIKFTTPPGHISFPIADNPTQYMSPKFRRKIEAAGQEAVKRIDALKPYKGGNDILWRLGKLNNIDKHRLLLTASTRYAFRSMIPADRARIAHRFPQGDKELLELVRWTSLTGPIAMLKVGDLLFVGPAGSELDKKMQFKFEVAFDEPQIIECESVIETLQVMFKLVKGIIPRFADLL